MRCALHDLNRRLQPCAFIASEYMLMGRLARYIKSNKHLLIRPQRITVVFVVSDVSTFLVQAAGALLSISKNQSLSKTGEHVCPEYSRALSHLSLTPGCMIDLLGRTRSTAGVICILRPRRAALSVPREDDGAAHLGHGQRQTVAQRLALPLLRSPD